RPRAPRAAWAHRLPRPSRLSRLRAGQALGTRRAALDLASAHGVGRAADPRIGLHRDPRRRRARHGLPRRDPGGVDLGTTARALPGGHLAHPRGPGWPAPPRAAPPPPPTAPPPPPGPPRRPRPRRPPPPPAVRPGPPR